MLTAARLALKQHRFEVGAAALAALVVGVAALVVDFQLRSIGVPAGCYATLSVSPTANDCEGYLAAFAAIDEQQAGVVFAAMAVLPFIVGLLCSVPIVGSELEDRTAQTAWSLTASRDRWLVRQLAPVMILLGAAILFAALAADALESTRHIRSFSAVSDLTLRGAPVVARAFGAFGIGLLLGTLLGRTLPALIAGAVVSIIVVFAAGVARDNWVYSQPTVTIDVSSGLQSIPVAASHGVAWLTPEGARIGDDEANGRVPPDQPEVDQWLFDNGYKKLEIVTTEAVALGWERCDVLAFAAVGVAGLASAAVVMNRRRPT